MLQAELKHFFRFLVWSKTYFLKLIKIRVNAAMGSRNRLENIRKADVNKDISLLVMTWRVVDREGREENSKCMRLYSRRLKAVIPRAILPNMQGKPSYRKYI